MATHVEGRLLRLSIPYVEGWIAELAASHAAPVPAAAAAAAGGKSADAPKGGKAQKGGTSSGDKGDETAMSRCCFAVGKVVEVSPHPDSQKLYVEKIDFGDDMNRALNGDGTSSPRVILSGLQEFVKQEDFLNRLVLVIANLEPRKIAGTPSNGMVLCASIEAGEQRQVVLLDVPEGTAVGERVVFEGHDHPYVPVLKKKLAKNFEEVIAEVGTNEKGEVCWKGIPFRTSAGVIKASLNNAKIS
ncbi:tyrosyl or methionyl-tRNA synthetase-like protein [Strigomonas culicis]|uniref:Glutamyl-Q tRNA(Asp) synthetase n=2 Tax=Strigomonas culicis TaxID=28005 RepID=S9WMN9_9TRYP|nr:glutamyl-Q tRNA(Asp) synthetase [Strigomonas culicis]EPY37215.1 tyrosyl or methionyl-tRNA synthetase-like protein [Strigomonas culicis]|eukprot:EPY28024.1 glutamyl-Q tRNA(Asp) synthetase [Strigomonas culicis]